MIELVQNFSFIIFDSPTMKHFYCFLLLLSFCTLGVAQSAYQKKLTYKFDLYHLFSIYNPFFGDFFDGVLTPTTIELEEQNTTIQFRLRPTLRVGYTLSPGREWFGQVSTYGTRVRYDFDLLAEGRTYMFGTGIRFYNRKKSALAPLGRYVELAANFHRGNNRAIGDGLLSQQTIFEGRFDFGKQYPISDKLLLDVGAGFGATYHLGFTFADTEYVNLEENTYTSYLLSNVFLFKVGLGIMR